MEEHDERFSGKCEIRFDLGDGKGFLYLMQVSSPLVTKGTFARYLRYYADIIEGKEAKEPQHIVVPMPPEDDDEDDEG